MPIRQEEPTRKIRFYHPRNESTRIDLFEELSHTALAALRAFSRRLGAPQLVDERILPTLQEDDARVFAAVRDRPWPPWGLGARHVSAVCWVQEIADESYAVSPVLVADEDLTNVGLMAAVYKEALESLAAVPHAEVNYLAAEGSTLADHVLASNGFRRHEDVFLTEHARYYTYRTTAADLLRRLGLDEIATPDLLAHEIPPAVLERNALFHGTVFLASRADWMDVARASEIIQLVRGGHAGKPGGVPSGTGRWGYPPEMPDWFVVLENFLGEHRQKLMEHLLSKEPEFIHSTVLEGNRPVVNERLRRSRTLDDLGPFRAVFEEKLKEVIAPVLARLKLPGFPLGNFEIQITASGDGDFYRMHRDGGSDSTRELSFVYFFHREPRRFSGGELRIFQSDRVDDKIVPTDRSQMLSPRQDAIVFFPSRSEHEILPVRVPTGAFGDSRFTVNGWVHRSGP